MYSHCITDRHFQGQSKLRMRISQYSLLKCLPSSSSGITWLYHLFRGPQVSFSCGVRSHRWLDGNHCVITVCKFQFFIQLFNMLITDRVTAQSCLDLFYCLQRNKFQWEVRRWFSSPKLNIRLKKKKTRHSSSFGIKVVFYSQKNFLREHFTFHVIRPGQERIQALWEC